MSLSQPPLHSEPVVSNNVRAYFRLAHVGEPASGYGFHAQELGGFDTGVTGDDLAVSAD